MGAGTEAEARVALLGLLESGAGDAALARKAAAPVGVIAAVGDAAVESEALGGLLGDAVVAAVARGRAGCSTAAIGELTGALADSRALLPAETACVWTFEECTTAPGECARTTDLDGTTPAMLRRGAPTTEVLDGNTAIDGTATVDDTTAVAEDAAVDGNTAVAGAAAVDGNTAVAGAATGPT